MDPGGSESRAALSRRRKDASWVGGTFGNTLGRLRSLRLIDYCTPGEVVALPVLFLEGAHGR
jgi:hypothetical protein